MKHGSRWIVYFEGMSFSQNLVVKWCLAETLYDRSIVIMLILNYTATDFENCAYSQVSKISTGGRM